MFNKEKQIKYWKDTSLSDIDTAKILIEKGKTIEGLFFCHLSIEKILKAHYVKKNQDFAPKTHNLKFLLDKTDLELNNEQLNHIALLMLYQIEGRYPDKFPPKITIEKANDYFNITKSLLSWLTKKC